MSTLIFVYNGDSGVINGVMHLLHKTFSPHTYQCQLCALVYDGTRQRQTWKAFVEALDIHVEYFHRDTFVRAYGEQSLALPAVLLKSDQTDTLQVVISAQDFVSIQTMVQLQDRIRQILVTDRLHVEQSHAIHA